MLVTSEKKRLRSTASVRHLCRRLHIGRTHPPRILSLRQLNQYRGRIVDPVVDDLTDRQPVRQMLDVAGRLEQRHTLRVQRPQLPVHVEADRGGHITTNLQRVGFVAMYGVGGKRGSTAEQAANSE